MDNVRELHNLFSKASIALNNRGISVIFTEELVQSVFGFSGPPPFDEEYRPELLRHLLSSSEAIEVTLNPGKSSSLLFEMPGISDEVVFFPPIEREISLEELRAFTDEYCSTHPLSEKGMEFCSFFDGADLSDSDEVFERLAEWVDYTRSIPRKIVSLSSEVRFRKMSNIARTLLNRGFSGVEIQDPDGWSDYAGGILIYFDEEIPKRRFSGEDKETLIELLELSEGFDIEVYSPGRLALIFDA